jgi:hypothetical protein
MMDRWAQEQREEIYDLLYVVAMQSTRFFSMGGRKTTPRFGSKFDRCSNTRRGNYIFHSLAIT